MSKLTSSKLFYPSLVSILDLLAWILYIVFHFIYSSTVDWDGYKAALDTASEGQEVFLESFYSGSSMILNFIAFLFLAIAIGLSIVLMVAWIKYFYNSMKEKKHE